jgi:hypothetical protein
MQRCPALREFSSAFKCFGESQACSGAHNLTIAARLAAIDALPDSIILAASPSLATRRVKRDTGCLILLHFLSRERK